MRRGQLRARYPVSTSRYGPGEQSGSLCTPRGRHVIRAMIGRGPARWRGIAAAGVPRRDMQPGAGRSTPERDWILSRILWLSGCEPGRNRLGAVDTMRRYIYIHGTPDSEVMGVPFSHGCIRMRNADVMRTVRRGAGRYAGRYRSLTLRPDCMLDVQGYVPVSRRVPAAAAIRWSVG